MICVAISDKDYRKSIALLAKVELAEIRLDLTEFDDEAIDAVFAQDCKLIATCRPDKMSEREQYFKLRRAIEAGASYVDIEIEAKDDQRDAIIEIAHKHDCKVIISYHNYESTPGLKDLYNIVDDCFEKGADVAKLATMVNCKADNARLMSLYSVEKPLVAVGMGQEGKVSRIMAPLLGAEFTFAADDDSEGTAPGQIAYSEMKQLLDSINKTINN